MPNPVFTPYIVSLPSSLSKSRETLFSIALKASGVSLKLTSSRYMVSSCAKFARPGASVIIIADPYEKYVYGGLMIQPNKIALQGALHSKLQAQPELRAQLFRNHSVTLVL